MLLYALISRTFNKTQPKKPFIGKITVYKRIIDNNRVN
jgi:hypothetical protein